MNRTAMANDLRGLLAQLPASMTIGNGTPITVALSAHSMETALLAYGSVENYRAGVIAARSDLSSLPAKNTPVTLTVPGSAPESLFVLGCREIDAVTVIIDLYR